MSPQVPVPPLLGASADTAGCCVLTQCVMLLEAASEGHARS